MAVGEEAESYSLRPARSHADALLDRHSLTRCPVEAPWWGRKRRWPATSHPDFDVEPPQGYGQYMWNVATTPGEHGRPVYGGGGSNVQQQAADPSGRNISWTPHDPGLGRSRRSRNTRRRRGPS